VAPAPIAFVTDYGTADTYAAALHAAVWRVDPSLLALTGMHGVPAGDLPAGAYHVKAMAAALPPGGVVCAVVDPGVGTERAALAVDLAGRRLVLPDNGLVSYLWDECPPLSRECVALPVPDGASPTFHGRDVFAPAAARLACGASVRELGAGRAEPVLLDEAFATVEEDEITGAVCTVDGFGNAITTVRERDLGGRRVAAVEWGGRSRSRGRSVLVVRTYADIPQGALGVLMGSAGHLEIAARESPASKLGAPGRGAAVRVHLA
jgi:S-adenosylmethionine hydrolase